MLKEFEARRVHALFCSVTYSYETEDRESRLVCMAILKNQC